MHRQDILFVSKPVAPPWNDSGKLLPYLIAKHLVGYRIAVLTPRDRPLDLPYVHNEPVYSASSSFAVPMFEKLRLLKFLMLREPPPLAHFFFTPNPPTVSAARMFRRRHPRTRVVQTIMSLPHQVSTLQQGIFADVVIAWSRLAEQVANDAIRDRGLKSRVVRIGPGIEPLSPMTREERATTRARLGLPNDRPVVLFAGDLEFSDAAAVTFDAAENLHARSQTCFVCACRDKTPAGRRTREALNQIAAPLIADGSVVVLGEVPDFHDLLRCVDCQILPAETTYAKTDLPLVVLEGLSAGVPAIVGTGTAMDELVQAGAAMGVPPHSPEALASLLNGLLQGRGCSALGATGRNWVLKNHTAAVMAEAHRKVYDELARYG